MGSDLRSDAFKCFSLLVEMVDNRVVCDRFHPLHKLMRNLQRRHSGVLPADLKLLWDRVRLPEQPSGPFHYHDGLERLCVYFDDEFNFKEIGNDFGDGDRADEGSGVVNWGDLEAGITKMEDRVGSGKEFDSEDVAVEGSSEGSEEVV